MSGIQQIPIKNYNMKLLKSSASNQDPLPKEAAADMKPKSLPLKSRYTSLSGFTVQKNENLRGIPPDEPRQESINDSQFNIQGQQYKTANNRIPVKMQINLRNGVLTKNKSMLGIPKTRGRNMEKARNSTNQDDRTMEPQVSDVTRTTVNHSPSSQPNDGAAAAVASGDKREK